MKKWSIYILAALLFAGCTDEFPDENNSIDPPKDEDKVTLTIQFPNSREPSTYAIDSKAENKISRLDVLSFTKGSGTLLSDELAYHIFISGDSILDTDATGRTKKVTTKLESMLPSQRLVLIANLPSNINLATVAKGTTMETIVDMLKFSGSTWRPPVAKTDTTSFPMFGQMKEYVQIHSDNSTMPTSLPFNMIRSVAKVDVGVDVNGTGDPALGFGSIFKIKNVHVYQASDSGYIAPHKDLLLSRDINATDTIIDKTNIVGNVNATDKRVAKIDYTFPTTGNILKNIIYLPETDTLKGSYKPAFLVVEASYMSGSSTFYRIDFTDDGKYVPLLRNHNYVINITGIRTEGYTTIEEAVAAPESRLNASLILDSNDDSGIKEVISYNNEYYLGVSSSNMYVDWKGQDVKVYVKTSYAGGWEASGQSGFTGYIDRSKNTSGRPTVLDSVRFTINPNTDVDGQPNVYTFNIKAGMLTQEITVTQSPGSNSYITKSGTAVTIPITSANVDGNNRSQYRSGAITQLWATSGLTLNISGVSGNTFTVTPTAGTGNAVVAMKNSTGDILYSWHIWVTDYDPEIASTQKSNNGFIFMDRNLGAFTDGYAITLEDTYGLYYQWGRKDPFKSTTLPVFGVDTIESNMSLALAIQHPDTFYATSYSSPYDWIGTSQNNSLWNTIDGKKGAYDPCPFGWRVPIVKDDSSGSPWYGFTSNSRNGASYPLAGYLDGFSGIRYDAATNGAVWGASARNQNAFIFKFTSSDAQQTSAFRANAYPVRCVKDSQ